MDILLLDLDGNAIGTARIMEPSARVDMPRVIGWQGRVFVVQAGDPATARESNIVAVLSVTPPPSA